MTVIPGDDSVHGGRIEITVEATAKGLAKRLEAIVDKAAANVAAKIDVTLDEKGLKAKLETTVDAAAKGVKAKIDVVLDEKKLEAKLAQMSARLSKDEKSKITTTVDGKDNLLGSVGRYIAQARAMAKANPVTVNVKTKKDSGGKGGKDGGMDFPDWLKPDGPARFLFRPTLILGLISLIQPAIATIVGALGGLAAMAGSAAASLNLIGAAGPAIGALVAQFAVFRIALSGISGDINKLPKPLRSVRKEFEALKKPWTQFKESVATRFWTQLQGNITKTGKSVIPILKDGLGDVAEAMGVTVKLTAAWMRTPLFKGQMRTVFDSIRSVTVGTGDALLGMLKGIVNLSDAAGPVMLKFSGVLSNFGKWAAGIGGTAEKQKKLGDAFEYAWQKGAQLWDMTKRLAGGLKAIFHAGRDVGDSLLGSFQDSIAKFEGWAKGSEGQAKIRAWFEAMAPITREVGNLIVDLGKALGRLAVDNHTADLLMMIRKDLIPSLETFLRNLGSTLGPAVVKFLTHLIDIFAQLSAAGGPLAMGLNAVSTVLEAIANLLEGHEELAKNLGAILGALIAFKGLTFFTGLIPGLAAFGKFFSSGGLSGMAGAAGGIILLSGALNGLPGPVQGAVAAISTLLAVVPHLNKGFGVGKTGKGANFIAGLTIMRDTMKGVPGYADPAAGAMSRFGASVGFAGRELASGAKRGLISGAKGLIGVLGGPWGIALTGASMALGGWIEAQHNAREAGEQFAATLDKQTGSLTAASAELAAKKLMGDISPDDIDLLESLGFSLREAADAALAGGDQLEKFRAKVQEASTEASKHIGAFDGETVARRSRDALDGLDSSLKNTNKDVELGRQLQRQFASATGEASSGTDSLGSALTRAAPPASTLADRLSELLGITMDARGANREYGQTMDDLKKHLANVKKGTSDFTEEGRANNAMLDQVASATMGWAEKQLAAGKSTGDVTKEVYKARDSFVAAAVKMGYTTSEANDLADQMGFTSTKVQGLKDKVDALKSKSITVSVEAAAAEAKIASLQRARDRLKDKTITMSVIRQDMVLSKMIDMQNNADGSITTFGAGGFFRSAIAALGDRVKTFAAGAENHIAQIASPGAWRVWAEPETGGEAYIPLALSKRARSLSILEEVARRFGLALMPLADSMHAFPAAAYAGAARAAAAAQPAGKAGSSVVFQPGSIQINNPAPEPASRSLPGALREVGTFGLFGDA